MSGPSRARQAWRGWVAIWDHREPVTALALIRILLGAVMLVDLLALARIGMVTAVYAPPPDGFARVSDGWAAAVGGPTLWLVAVIAAACITCGAATRVACVVFVVVTAQLGDLAPGSDRGIHMLARIVFVILALSSSHHRWSVDAWLWARLGRALPREVPAWPRYLILVQLIWVYFSAGMNKAGAEWGPVGGFSALANALTDPHFARFDPSWVATIAPLAAVATATTMAFELLAPLYLVAYLGAVTASRGGRWRRWLAKLRLRWAWLAVGVTFHLGIAVFLRIGSFPWGMLALYPALLRPEELTRSGRDA